MSKPSLVVTYWTGGASIRRALVFGVYGRLGAVGHADLVEDVADVPVDRVDADHEFVGDLLVALASGDETQDFDFAVRESCIRVLRCS